MISIFNHPLIWIVNSFYIPKSYLLTNTWHRQILLEANSTITALYWEKSAVLTHDADALPAARQRQGWSVSSCMGSSGFSKGCSCTQSRYVVIQFFQKTSGAWGRPTPALLPLRKLKFPSPAEH